MRGLRRGGGKARVIGKAGQSADAAYRRLSGRNLIARYRQVRTKMLAVAGALLTGLAASGAHALGLPVLASAAICAGVLVTVHVAIKWPSFTATSLVLLAFAPFVPAVSLAYSFAGSAGRKPDATGGLITLVAAALLTAILAHKTSRSRPWLTTLLALAAICLLGPILLTVAPTMGFIVAYLLAGIVVFLRAGGVSRTADRVAGTIARIRGAFSRKPADADAEAWRRGAEGERRTAAILADLDASHIVMHDLALPGTDANADHVVLGPSGVFYLDSKMYRGVVREDPEQGLMHNQRPLAETLGTVLFERDRVAAALGLPASDVQAIVVIHEAVLPGKRTRVALYDENAERIGEVVVVAPDAVLAEVNSGIEVLNRRTLHRLVRKAKSRLVPATAGAAKPNVADLTPSAFAAGAAVLDADGQPKTAPKVEALEPLFASTTVDTALPLATRVALLTPDGTFDGYRISDPEPFADSDGTVKVRVCPEEEWQAAQHEGRAPREVYLFPQASVQAE